MLYSLHLFIDYYLTLLVETYYVGLYILLQFH